MVFGLSFKDLKSSSSIVVGDCGSKFKLGTMPYVRVIFGRNATGTEIGSDVKSANCFKYQGHIVAAYCHNKDLKKLSAFLATARAKRI